MSVCEISWLACPLFVAEKAPVLPLGSATFAVRTNELGRTQEEPSRLELFLSILSVGSMNVNACNRPWHAVKCALSACKSQEGKAV